MSLFGRRQHEKISSTRQALLDSAVAVLVDKGLSRFSVAAVASRAGLSTGALFFNYPNRAALMAAMTKHLFDSLESQFVLGATEGLAGAGDRAAALVDAVWMLYNDPRMRAALELYASSRTDPDLATLLAAIDAERTPRHVALAESLIASPNLDRSRLSAVVSLVVLTIQGLALDQLTGGNQESTGEVLALLREIARGLVEPGN